MHFALLAFLLARATVHAGPKCQKNPIQKINPEATILWQNEWAQAGRQKWGVWKNNSKPTYASSTYCISVPSVPSFSLCFLFSVIFPVSFSLRYCSSDASKSKELATKRTGTNPATTKWGVCNIQAICILCVFPFGAFPFGVFAFWSVCSNLFSFIVFSFSRCVIILQQTAVKPKKDRLHASKRKLLQNGPALVTHYVNFYMFHSISSPNMSSMSCRYCCPYFFCSFTSMSLSFLWFSITYCFFLGSFLLLFVVILFFCFNCSKLKNKSKSNHFVTKWMGTSWATQKWGVRKITSLRVIPTVTLYWNIFVTNSDILSALRSLDFIKIILSSSSLLLVRGPAVTTVILSSQTDSNWLSLCLIQNNFRRPGVSTRRLETPRRLETKIWKI